MGRKTPPFALYPKWTEARFWGFLRSSLRNASRRWPPKIEAKVAVRRKYIGDNKRVQWEYQCCKCKDWFMDKEVEVHHKEPVGTLTNYDEIGEFVRKLFCGKEGFEVMCKKCHLIETNKNR